MFRWVIISLNSIHTGTITSGKGPFTKDVRGESGRGVSEIRTNSDIGLGHSIGNVQ